MQVLPVLLRKIKTAVQAPWDEKWMFFEAFFLCGYVRLALLVIPFRKLAPKLGRHKHETSRDMDWAVLDDLRKVRRAVNRASLLTPWQSKCFVQAIAGKIMLRKRGFPSTIYLGVCKDREKKEGLKAHAWLRSGQLIVTGREGMMAFTVVATFGEE